MSTGFLESVLHIVPFKQPPEDNYEELELWLLINDNHLSHMWYGTLDLERQKSVIVIKLPSHTTDMFQPSNVAVIISLKDHWVDVLFQSTHVS